MDNERDGKHKEGREEIRERLGENQGEIRIRRDEDQVDFSIFRLVDYSTFHQVEYSIFHLLLVSC